MGQLHLSYCLTMWSIATICLAIFAASAAEKSRHPRLFFVSSSSTTSTLSTTTLCYSTTGTGFTTTACAGRKKRAIYTDPVTGELRGLEDIIQPQEPVSFEEKEKANEDELIESGRKEYEREGKFLLYWKTTTTTSTFTTYTATTTIGALGCTPSNFAISQCPSNGKK